MPPSDLSYLYFLVDAEGSAFKVGVSSNIPNRISVIPEEVDISRSLQFLYNRSDVFKAEKAIHFLFESERVIKPFGDGYTEWFSMAAFEEMKSFLISNKNKFKWISHGSVKELVSERFEIADIIESELEHIKLYIEELGQIIGLQDSYRSILLHIAASIPDDGIISMTSHRKNRIASAIGCAKRSIDNAICALINHRVLIRVARGEYELNPQLFAKGRWTELRRKKLRFTAKITYSSITGRTIETEISKEVTQTEIQPQPDPVGL